MRMDCAVVALALVVSSCGDDAPEGPGPVPIDQLRALSVGAQCDYLVRCGWEPDKMTCRRVDGADDDLLQLIADAKVGKVHYDGAAARVWIDTVRARVCPVHGPAADAKVRDAWKPVFKGTIPGGGPCWVDDECQGAAACDLSACNGEPCCAGQCVQATAPIPIGQACDGSIPCADGSYCDGECKPRVDLGKPCNAQDACKDNQGCDQDGTGNCIPLVGTGEKCDPMLQVSCANYQQFCNSKNVCATLPRDGEPCDEMGPGCLSYAVCVGGTCVRRPTEGEACDMLECLGDLRCDNGMCRTRTLHVCSG